MPRAHLKARKEMWTHIVVQIRLRTSTEKGLKNWICQLYGVLRSEGVATTGVPIRIQEKLEHRLTPFLPGLAPSLRLVYQP